MSGFTKGPWVIKPEECGKDYIRIRGGTLGGRFKIANVITPIYHGVRDRELNETRANAYLIAAAPDMHEALCYLRDQLAFLKGDDYDLVAMADKALAKARGEK